MVGSSRAQQLVVVIGDGREYWRDTVQERMNPMVEELELDIPEHPMDELELDAEPCNDRNLPSSGKAPGSSSRTWYWVFGSNWIALAKLEDCKQCMIP